jgi:hypothetical protein
LLFTQFETVYATIPSAGFGARIRSIEGAAVQAYRDHGITTRENGELSTGGRFEMTVPKDAYRFTYAR